jgi:hypothetical protein
MVKDKESFITSVETESTSACLLGTDISLLIKWKKN